VPDQTKSLAYAIYAGRVGAFRLQAVMQIDREKALELYPEADFDRATEMADEAFSALYGK
jgi:hypothetical protein